ncbi:UNVERIFIED_CONTAM: hypothetical protein GTU68_067117 [Idotea baltica]|nr:hypothetical protein [Idotea baltica]
MNRYFVELSYWGTHYAGWQVQPNAVTVQSTIEEAISTILNVPTSTMGCGRTDSGVHASQFFLHFEAQDIPENLIYRLNKFLPKDIAIKRIFPVREKAHTRHDAKYRAYEYRIHFDKNPFLFGHSYFYPWLPLDRAAMETAVKMLAKYKNFKSFEKTNSDARTSLCDIYRSELAWDDQANRLTFHIAANRFLRGMVRLIVGSILMVGKGKINLAEFQKGIEEQSRFGINISAPAQGLFLNEVRYNWEEILPSQSQD